MINGKRLKALRKRERMSAEELADYLGVGRQQIVRYEAEQTEVTTDKLLKIAQFFDVTTDYLLGNSDAEQAYKRGSRSTIDLDRLIKLNPATAARFIMLLDVKVEPNPLLIDIEYLLTKFPPVYIAEFLKELGIEYEVKPRD